MRSIKAQGVVVRAFAHGGVQLRHEVVVSPHNDSPASSLSQAHEFQVIPREGTSKCSLQFEHIKPLSQRHTEVPRLEYQTMIKVP